MAFDVDAFRAAHRPWSFTVGRRTFGAKHVSAVAVAQYEAQARDALSLTLRGTVRDRVRGERQQVAALRWLLRRAFPWRVDYLIRGDPVDILVRLEPAARAEALRDFFACLQGKERTNPATPPQTNPTPPTPGMRSPGPTPPRNP